MALPPLFIPCNHSRPAPYITTTALVRMLENSLSLRIASGTKRTVARGS